jgi:hypothetical protein
MIHSAVRSTVPMAAGSRNLRRIARFVNSVRIASRSDPSLAILNQRLFFTPPLTKRRAAGRQPSVELASTHGGLTPSRSLLFLTGNGYAGRKSLNRSLEITSLYSRSPVLRRHCEDGLSETSSSVIPSRWLRFLQWPRAGVTNSAAIPCRHDQYSPFH